MALLLSQVGCRELGNYPVFVNGVAASEADTTGKRTAENAVSVARYKGDGGVAIMVDPDAGLNLCVAPPAQSAIALAKALEHKGKVNAMGKVEVEQDWSYQTTETIAKLYEQSERSLFLQFALYRLCEAYANGMLNNDQGVTKTEFTYEEIGEKKEKGKLLSKKVIRPAQDCTPLGTNQSSSQALLTNAQKSYDAELGKLSLAQAAFAAAITAYQSVQFDPKIPDATKSQLKAVAETKKALFDSQAKPTESALTALKVVQEIAIDDADAYRGCLQGRTLYDTRFSHVLQIAKEMQVADAEKAKAEAEKAKAESATATLKAKAEAYAKELAELRKKALDVLVATKDKTKVDPKVVGFAVDCKGDCAKEDDKEGKKQ